MAGMELTAAVAAVVWMVLMVLSALLVHLVLRVSQDRRVPWVRRGGAGPTGPGRRAAGYTGGDWDRRDTRSTGRAGTELSCWIPSGEIQVHQRAPIDQDLPITVCVVD